MRRNDSQRRDRVTLLEVCAARAATVESGTIAAARLAGMVCAYVIEWRAYMRTTDEPTVIGYGRWAHVSQRTAFYRNEGFHRLFPDLPNPTRLAEAIDDRRTVAPDSVAVAS